MFFYYPPYQGVALVVFAMTMQVVSNMHSQHILHNDFSLGNLLFDEHLNPVCIDFGLGRKFEVSTENGLELLCFGETGTIYYASHEALGSKDDSGRFRGYTSTKGDVYAVTAVLFDTIFCRSLSNDSRFGESSVPPIPWEWRLSQVVNAERSDAIRSVLGLFGQCLQHNPLMRPSAATAVQNARQFASILLSADAMEALDRVLDGTFKQYPWKLFSKP
jgi:serine/threonine protein kinase